MVRNSQFQVDMDKAIKKWTPIVEKLGVTDKERIASLCEYAEMHATSLASGAVTNGLLKENVMYANGSNTSGMGAVSFPSLSGIPGQQGTTNGSGDLGQTLLPASLKIAAMTIGLELVPTINVNSNRVDFLYWDFRYDDNASLGAEDERASTFKIDISGVAGLETYIRARMTALGVTEGRGTISAPIYFDISGTSAATLTAPAGSKANWLQFKGFSRIDGKPMFRAYIQKNTASSGAWSFSTALNTFAAAGTMLSQLQVADFLDSTISTVGAVLNPTLVSINEDFIDDFTTDRNAGTLTRAQWDTSEAGKIGVTSETASIEIGVAHVSAALRLSEIGDWKRMYGVDVVEKTKAQLVNQISQKISMEIVTKVKAQCLLNRATAPLAPSGLAAGLALASINDGRIYDFSVSATAGSLGGENHLSIANKLWGKIMQGSYFVSVDGRIGGVDYIITTATVAGILKNIQRYTLNPLDGKIAGPNQLMPAGSIDGIKIYVDPYAAYGDLTVYMGRKGKADEPGVKFFAYMLAENVEVVSERTMAPHLYMYSRYAVGTFGYFPHKQYMAIKVEDVNGILY
jgi:hypothetical protein